MIKIVNVGELLPPGYLVALEVAIADTALRNLAEAARAEWLRLAGERLFSTRRDYMNGVLPVDMADGAATIALVGMLPNLLENGMPETDLHNTLLGPNVPIVGRGGRGKHASKAGGYHRAIPFRHAGPSSGGAVGQPMGRPYTGHEAVADAKKLGRDIYKAAKALGATTSQPGGPTSWGERLPEGLAPLLRPYHATDIYAGMVREEKTYKKATQSQYATFRTIAVDAQGSPVGKSPWIRPATSGVHLLREVESFVNQIAPHVFAGIAGET